METEMSHTLCSKQLCISACSGINYVQYEVLFTQACGFVNMYVCNRHGGMHYENTRRVLYLFVRYKNIKTSLQYVLLTVHHGTSV
jgi:hypothetical protein